MKSTLCLIALLSIAPLIAQDAEDPTPGLEPPKTAGSSPAETNALPAAAAKTNALPAKLLSTQATLPKAPIPVYVLPEAIVVQTPSGPFVFVESFHVQELARKFPSRRLTNIVIWVQP